MIGADLLTGSQARKGPSLIRILARRGTAPLSPIRFAEVTFRSPNPFPHRLVNAPLLLPVPPTPLQRDGDTLLPQPVPIAPRRKPLTAAPDPTEKGTVFIQAPQGKPLTAAPDPLAPGPTEKGTVFIPAAVPQLRRGRTSSAGPSLTRWGRSSFQPNQKAERDRAFSATLLPDPKLSRIGTADPDGDGVYSGNLANGCRTRIRKGTVFSEKAPLRSPLDASR